MGSEGKRWSAIAEEIESVRARFGGGELGARRTATDAKLPTVTVDETAFMEREPITVILSEKGWIRAQKGHLGDDVELRFKEGDALKLLLHCETTDRIVVFATNGRAYTLKAEAIPRGRGDGQPVRLMLELGNEDDVVTILVPGPESRFLVASTDARGFLVRGEELFAEKRTGKQVLVPETSKEAMLCVPAEGDTVAVSTPGKLLVFPLDQVPEMTRGRGVALIGGKDVELRDAKVFRAREGLAWRHGNGVRVETDLRAWRGQRASAGKLHPDRFPKSRRFEV
jgi:topoisomerase-4 subunit A